MNFREALPADIAQMHVVRWAVKENRLSNPALVTENDYLQYITSRGKGWVCETDAKIVGFAIADLWENNIWALFVDPDYEKKGIGKKLHDIMLTWYFRESRKTVWLGTGPNTRAEQFYRMNGWQETGKHANGEVLFEYSYEMWKSRPQKPVS